jgi:hypothetical protein
MNKHRASKQDIRKARKAVTKFLCKQTARAAGRLHSELFVVMMPKEARR